MEDYRESEVIRMGKKLDRCIKKVKKKKGVKSAYAICKASIKKTKNKSKNTLRVGDLFKSTTFNKGHKHKWMKGRGYTTVDSNHSHKINIKKMLAMAGGKDKHIHRLLKK